VFLVRSNAHAAWVPAERRIPPPVTGTTTTAGNSSVINFTQAYRDQLRGLRPILAIAFDKESRGRILCLLFRPSLNLSIFRH
jgi:hypothetical protein